MTIALIVIVGVGLVLLLVFAGPMSRRADDMPKEDAAASARLEQQRLWFRR
jgi:hypothetical protein